MNDGEREMIMGNAGVVDQKDYFNAVSDRHHCPIRNKLPEQVFRLRSIAHKTTMTMTTRNV